MHLGKKELKIVLLIVSLFTSLCAAHTIWRFGGGGPYHVYLGNYPWEIAGFNAKQLEPPEPEPDWPVSLLPGEKIDLNTAPAKELERLPTVGPVTAQAIVDWRENHGPFTDLRQLTLVEGFGKESYRQIRDYITLGDGT